MFDLEKAAVEKYAWMREKSTQQIGNKQIIVPIDKLLWDKFVKQMSPEKTFEDYLAAHGKVYASFIKKGNGDWELSKVRDLERARGVPQVAEWQKKVRNFDSPEAQKQLSTADDDVFEYQHSKRGRIVKAIPKRVSL